MTTYTPTVWHSNDLITSEKLNKIEDSIEELQNIQTNFTTPPSYNEVLALLSIGIFPKLNDKIIYKTIIANDMTENVIRYGYSLSDIGDVNSSSLDDSNDSSYLFNDQDSHEPVYIGHIDLAGGGGGGIS